MGRLCMISSIWSSDSPLITTITSYLPATFQPGSRVSANAVLSREESLLRGTRSLDHPGLGSLPILSSTVQHRPENKHFHLSICVVRVDSDVTFT